MGGSFLGYQPPVVASDWKQEPVFPGMSVPVLVQRPGSLFSQPPGWAGARMAPGVPFTARIKEPETGGWSDRQTGRETPSKLGDQTGTSWLSISGGWGESQDRSFLYHVGSEHSPTP